MHEDAPAPTDLLADLPDGLDKRQRFDIAHGAADFRQDHVDVLGGDPLDLLADRSGHVRDDLHGLAEVVATTLLGQYPLVDAAAGGIVGPRQYGVSEALVVAEV